MASHEGRLSVHPSLWKSPKYQRCHHWRARTPHLGNMDEKLYGPLQPESGNTLHILRLVIEDEVAASTFSSQTEEIGHNDDSVSLGESVKQLEAIIQIAQREAAAWELSHVELWNPTSLIRHLIELVPGPKQWLNRETLEVDQSIPALLWFGEGKGDVEELEWFGNEKYGWC